MRVFLPDIYWLSLEDRRAAVFERALPIENLPPPLKPLEKLIEYSFNKKVLLIEAMAHASCNSGVASLERLERLERLEFLDDALLDSIIVNEISGHEVELSHVEMHHLRTVVCVNADFLASMCMEWAVEQEVGGVVEDKTTHSFHTTTSSVSLALWKFMLRASHVLGTVQLEASKRHRVLRDEINSALATGSHYPWALLSQLSAPKFCSDIVESLLGAVYIDFGSTDACEGITERMGILPYLRRVIRDGVHTLHPMEEMGIVTDVKKVKYVVKLEKKIIESVESRVYTCEVFVRKMSVALVSDGVSREEAKTNAAEAAVRVLKQLGASGRGIVLQQEENITLDDEMNMT
jgi:dsRNA-specific ribonuclease